MRACRRKWHLVFPTLYIIIVYRVNLNKLLQLSRNLVGAIRTTTINCKVSFIDLYSVFPRNCRMVFLPHTNTVILLEPCCGTMTKPGLPVMVLTKTIIASGNGIGQILLRIMSVNKPSLSLSLKSGFRFRRIH